MKNWNADEWHLFLCQHCDNRATSPNGLNKVALAIVDEIDEVTAAKRRALQLADERAIEANGAWAKVGKLEVQLAQCAEVISQYRDDAIRDENTNNLLRAKLVAKGDHP
jgi:hypothetical protein